MEVPGIIDLPDDIVEHVDGMHVYFLVLRLPQPEDLVVGLLREAVATGINALLVEYGFEAAEVEEGVLDAADLGQEGS
jgi:hypothetical protein